MLVELYTWHILPFVVMLHYHAFNNELVQTALLINTHALKYHHLFLLS